MAKKQTIKKKVSKKTSVSKCEKTKVTTQEKTFDDEKAIKKTDIFELFCVWSTLPTLWKGKDEEFLRTKGVEDDEILELLSCARLKDFAKKYDVHVNTLSKWKKKQRVRDHLSDMRIWMSRMSGNVMLALYREATGTNVAPGIFKEYFKTVHHVGERVDLSMPEELREAIGKINKLLPN